MYHTIDICQDIAEKLRSPINLYEIVENEIKQGTFASTKWLDLSLASGLPGIACFYTVMDRVFPDQKWDDVAHQYLKLAVNRYETEGINNYSMYYGLCGLCYAAYLCSKQGDRYQNLLRKLDTALIQEIEKGLSFFSNDEAINFPYNLSYGFSGILAYLLLRKENSYFQKLVRDFVEIIVNKLMKKKNIGSSEVPGWHISHEDPLFHFDEVNKKYANGGFILSTPEGILGILSTISIAAWEGHTSSSTYKAIEEIVTWLKLRQIKTSHGFSWPYYTGLEDETEKEMLQSHIYDSWSFGIPSVAYSLYLAGRTLQDKHIKSFAEDSFLFFLSTQIEDRTHPDPSFASGKAGILALTYRMGKLTNNGLFMRYAQTLENELKKLYNPSHPFGFQFIVPRGQTREQMKKFNEPGFLDGAIGIALTLLSVDRCIDDIPWDRFFLLR